MVVWQFKPVALDIIFICFSWKADINQRRTLRAEAKGSKLSIIMLTYQRSDGQISGFKGCVALLSMNADLNK